MLPAYSKQILLIVSCLIIISVVEGKKKVKVTCPAGYTGPTCSTIIEIDNCAGSPCKHGGTCISTASGHTCKCAAGYKGRKCNKKIAAPTDHCAGSPCKHGGTCSNTASGFTCKCAAGYKGRKCNKKIAAPTDHCANSPCKNGGICTNSASGYTCKCAAGYTGKRCTTKTNTPTNYCASSPCLNGGTCNNGANGYTCACGAGFNGAQCATTDYCFNSPCQNGGVCTNSPGGYLCTCAYGYSGAQCNVAKYLTFNSYGDDNQQVFVDGNLLGSAGSWTQKVSVRFPAGSKVLATFVTNAGGSTGGIVGSATTDFGSTAFVTDSSWRCINNQTPAPGWNTANFDDSSWTPATATLKAPEHPDINSAAFWLCLGSYWDTRNFYCRKTIPQNLV